MAGRFGLVACAVLVVALASSAAGRGVLSVNGKAKYDLDDVRTTHRTLMSSLKEAQEKAGIFVNDEHLFTRPLTQGRRLHQATDLVSIISNPTVVATLLSLVSQGLSLGSFPGAALNLPGGSPFGYAPTDDSYCLFSTAPYEGSPAPAISIPAFSIPGAPLPAGGGGPLSPGAGPRPGQPGFGGPGGLPEGFACIEANASKAGGPNTFAITLNGGTYICSGSNPQAPSSGRKLQQLDQQLEQLQSLQQIPLPNGKNDDKSLADALAKIGLPIWNCVVATTPDGNTTLGSAVEAILNDIGVVGEHLLVYLNANGALTYEQDIKNDFVSLTNPLYPTGPRLNFSIDFEEVTKDAPILEELFRPAAPPAPEVPAVQPGASGATSPPATGGDSGSNAAPGSQGTSSLPLGTSPTIPANAPTTAVVQTPQGAVTVPLITKFSVFDGYLDKCQSVIGEVPDNNGNFARNNNYSTEIIDGVSNMTVQDANTYAGQVAYVIPASKDNDYPPLTSATRKQATYCYDVATLQPVYNPLATFVIANSSAIAASPASTVAVFGKPYGLTTDELVQATCTQLPAGQTLETYDALGAAANGSAQGLNVLKTNVEIANLVTTGANLLTNDTQTYASYAIIMDQAIAQEIKASPQGNGRRLQQQAGAPGPAGCSLDFTNPTTTTNIITRAQQSVPQQFDDGVPAPTNVLTSAEISAAGQGVANLNANVRRAQNASATELGQWYAETQLAPQVSQLGTGELSATEFTQLTSANTIDTFISRSQLPGELVPAAVRNPSSVFPTTQSGSQTTESSSSSSGLSHGGKVALATILPIVGVIALIAAVAYYVSRRNSTPAVDSQNNSAVWWRRPFARSGGSASPIAGSSSSV